MPTTVKLQGAMQYPVWPILLLLLVWTVAIICYRYVRKKENLLSQEQDNSTTAWVLEEAKVKALKDSYKQKLIETEQQYRQGELSEKQVFYELSRMVREFSQEMNGDYVQNCTLEEIQEKNLPQLESLIRSYYKPEFGNEPCMNVREAMKLTKRMIEQWH